jgi:hypothetical protein
VNFYSLATANSTSKAMRMQQRPNRVSAALDIFDYVYCVILLALFGGGAFAILSAWMWIFTLFFK